MGDVSRGSNICNEDIDGWRLAGPSTSSGSIMRVFTPGWTIDKDDSILLDSLKNKELMLGIILSKDMELLQCMSTVESLACMYYHTIWVGGSSFQDPGHNIDCILMAWLCRQASVLSP